MIVDTGYAPIAIDSGWLGAVEISSVGDQLVNPDAAAVWTLTVTENTMKLSDSNGVTVAPKGSNKNGIKDADYSWDWTFADGKFQFKGVGTDTARLASNGTTSGSYPDNYRFRGYKNTTVGSDFSDQFSLYKLVDGEPTPPTPPVDLPIDASKAVASKDVLAGEKDAEFVVKGVVTMADGWNVYLQDESGAIAPNLAKKDTTLKSGDTLLATGLRKENNGMPYLGERNNSAIIEKSSGMSLTVKIPPLTH